LILGGALVALAVGWLDTCALPTLLPAYSHNDYLSARPLIDALAAGYRGLEVDLYRNGQRLMVGHDRRSALRFHTLDALYLRRMQERLARCGFVLAPGVPFLLNLELKEEDPEAFQLLVTELTSYEASLFRDGHVRPVLVGWWPASPPPQVRWPSYLAVQLPFVGRPAPETAPPGPPIGFVSVDYSETLRWNGRGLVPERAQALLTAALRLGNALGVPVRVHQVPVRAAVFDWLLRSGTDLIGVRQLESATPLLLPRPVPNRR